MGTALPRMPKAVREITMVGAEARLPARLIWPTRKNEAMIPSAAATAVGMKSMPNAVSKAAMETLNNEMLDVAHGQKRERGVPCRSSSGMTLMPLVSTCMVGGDATDPGSDERLMRASLS